MSPLGRSCMPFSIKSMRTGEQEIALAQLVVTLDLTQTVKQRL